MGRKRIVIMLFFLLVLIKEKKGKLNVEKEYIERLIETEQRSKSNTKRLDSVENKVEDIHSLTLSINQIATEVKAMREELNKVDKRLLTLEEKPSKRMDTIWGNIVSALIGGLIGYFLLKLGLK